MPYRLTHMLLASGLTVVLPDSPAFPPGAGCAAIARRMYCRRCAPAWPSRRSLVPLQIFVGDLHGLNTLEHQPAKIAAMEGVWKTERSAPLLLFALA